MLQSSLQASFSFIEVKGSEELWKTRIHHCGMPRSTSNERLDWLLEALNLDEKCRMFSTLTPEVARLGIRSTYLGEEAAHGVEAKHDRSVNWGAPKPTTTFPQLFGMSQTWDTKLMEKNGGSRWR